MSHLDCSDDEEALGNDGLDLTPLQTLRVPVIFVVGPPGAGKATQCRLLTERFNLNHISMGATVKSMFKQSQSEELLRLQSIVESGGLLPLKDTMKVLQKRMLAVLERNEAPFLIHGFPRTFMQAVRYERTIGFPAAVILLEASDDTLRKRIENRRATSRGERREDDVDEETLATRLQWYRTSIQELSQYYQSHRKLYVIDAERPTEMVQNDIAKVMYMWTC